MDFNEAAVFVKVVQAGGFSAAARQLGLPTSTISTRISRLEKRLGITLLQRTTRRLHLTEAGTVYFHHASQGLGFLLEAEAAIAEGRQQVVERHGGGEAGDGAGGDHHQHRMRAQGETKNDDGHAEQRPQIDDGVIH